MFSSLLFWVTNTQLQNLALISEKSISVWKEIYKYDLIQNGRIQYWKKEIMYQKPNTASQKSQPILEMKKKKLFNKI